MSGDCGHPAEGEPLETTGQTLSLTSSCLSCIGVIFILVGSFNYPAKTMSRNIIYMVSIGNLLLSFSILSGVAYSMENGQPNNEDESYSYAEVLRDRTACKVQSVFVLTGSYISMLWTTGLAQHTFLVIKYGIKVAYQAYLTLFGLSLLPLILLPIALYYSHLGSDNRDCCDSEIWCFVNVDDDSNASCKAFMYSGREIEAAAYIICLFYCVASVIQIRRLQNSLEDSSESIQEFQSIDATNIHKILLIPLVFVLIRTPGTLHDFLHYCSSENCSNNKALIILKSLLDPLQGFLNWIIYWFTLRSFISCPSCCRLSLRYFWASRTTGYTHTVSHDPHTEWRIGAPDTTSLSASSYHSLLR